jgi:phenylalanine-4-hydroxylase, monomeric form
MNPAETVSKNRYANAKRNPDFTIDQDWQSYTPEEHDRWDRLYARAVDVLQTRACPEFLEALGKLKLSEGGVPDMEKLSERLFALTGWRVVPVVELVPDDVFFDHLANRRFPAGAFIRPEREMDYLKEPDIFHDIFGHVPLLADPVYAAFMEAYGKGGQRAMARGALKNLARLYWYTVEFGLVRAAKGSDDLKLFGAGIMSSAAESVFALADASPNRVGFDLERVMRTDYIIDDFQQTYFVIDSFEDLLAACEADFGPLYDRVVEAETIGAHEIVAGDRVFNKGTLAYFRAKRPIAFSHNEFSTRMAEFEATGWTVEKGGRALLKTFRFESFPAAIRFMERVAPFAEKADHHPEWTNVHDRVEVRLTTHTAGGVTEMDLDLARRMDAVVEASREAA